MCLWWCWLQRWQGHIDGDTTHCVYNDADCKDDRDTLMAILHIVFMMMLTAKMTGTHWWRHYTLCLWWCWLQRWQGHIDGDNTHCVYDDADCKDDRDTLMAIIHIVFMMMLTVKMTGTHWWRYYTLCLWWCWLQRWQGHIDGDNTHCAYDDADCKDDRDTLMAILHIVFMMMLTVKMTGTHWWRYYTLCLWWCWLQRWQGHIDGDTTHCVYDDADCKDDRDTLMAIIHIVLMMMLTAKMTGTHWWRYYTLCLWWCWLQRWQGHIDGDTTHCVYDDADCKDDRDTLMAILHIVFMMMLTAKMTGTHWWR